MFKKLTYLACFFLLLGLFCSNTASAVENIWGEAELADSITAPFVVEDDPCASGGKYIVNPAVGGSNNTNPPTTGIAKYNVTLTEGGTYKLFLRVLCTVGGDGDDSCYVRIQGATPSITPGGNDGWTNCNNIDGTMAAADTQVWFWAQVREYGTTFPGNVITFDIPKGSYTIEIAWRENGLKIDSFLISNDPNIVAADLPNQIPTVNNIWREAEAADTLTLPYEILTDPDASGGKYINAKPGTAYSTAASPAPDGTASFIFDAPAGTYKVAIRLKIIEGVNSYDNDSLWVRMDSGNWITFNNISHAGNVWHWDTVHNSNSGNAIVEFALEDGQHVLEISYRETNCLIDAVLITDDPELDESTLPDVIPVDRPDAALIVNSDDLMCGFDAAQYDRLKTLGYDVIVYTGDEVKEDANDPNALTVAIAETFDVIVISASVNPGDVNELANINVPVMAQGNWTNLGYTSYECGLTDVNMVNLIDANNPVVIDANLVTGPMKFFTDVTSTTIVNIAALPAGAVKLVQKVDSNNVIVFAIEMGKKLVDPNAVAADRIVGFSLPGQDMMDADQLTEDAWALYDAAITWLNPGLDLLDGIVAYYPMDGDANDVSGNELNGTLSVRGAATNVATFVDGISGQAIDLLPDSGATGPYVDCSNDEMFNLEDAVSVSVWVKIRSLPDQYTAIVVKGEQSWRLMTEGSSSKIHFGIANYGERSPHALIGATNLVMNEWYHICGTYDINVGATLYINGQVDGTLVDHLGIQQNTEPVWIGADSNATWKPGRCFDGQIDEVMIYDRALTPKEVNTLAGK